MEEVEEIEEKLPFSVPRFKKWDMTDAYDYDANIIDYESLEALDKTIQNARKSMFILTEKINTFERKEREAKTKYERAYRREYLNSTEKTETAKKARAELKCEELENKWMALEQLKQELLRLSYTMKQEMQILQTIANNMRQQLKI